MWVSTHRVVGAMQGSKHLSLGHVRDSNQQPHYNSCLDSALQTVKCVYTAAGTYFPSSHSHHSTKAQTPQSAMLSGFMVLGRAATTDHTHNIQHIYTRTCVPGSGVTCVLMHWERLSGPCTVFWSILKSECESTAVSVEASVMICILPASKHYNLVWLGFVCSALPFRWGSQP